jgi:ParB-like chromosome segregation protein Spo0J
MQANYIKVGARFRKDLGNLDALVESIREVGLLHPVVVDDHGNLIAGERRLGACVRLGWRDVPATIVNLDDDQTIRAQDDENQVRKNFTPTEAVAIRDARLAREKAKAKERINAGTEPSDNLFKGRARDKAAAGTGYSGQTVDKAAAVLEAAAADPELEPVVTEMDRTGKVDPAYRKAQAAKAAKNAKAAGKRGKTIAAKNDDDAAEPTTAGVITKRPKTGGPIRQPKRETPSEHHHVIELVRRQLTDLREQYAIVTYWQPVWDAIDAVNGVTR